MTNRKADAIKYYRLAMAGLDKADPLHKKLTQALEGLGATSRE